MKSKFGLRAEGMVRMTFDYGMGIKKEYTYKNTILPLAKTIVAHRLANLDDSKIDSIKVFLIGGLVASGMITDTTLISDTEVEFTALFPAASFAGNFDEVRLNASGLGDFSQLVSFIATKDTGVPLTITWKIKII